MKEVASQDKKAVQVVTYGEDVESEWVVYPICCQTCNHRWVAIINKWHIGLGVHCPMCRIITIFAEMRYVPSA